MDEFTVSYLRPASTISDLEMLQIIDRNRDSFEQNGHVYSRAVGVRPLSKALDIHPNRVRSKLRRMWKRNLVECCLCGCQGDIRILHAGEQLLVCTD